MVRALDSLHWAHIYQQGGLCISAGRSSFKSRPFPLCLATLDERTNPWAASLSQRLVASFADSSILHITSPWIKDLNDPVSTTPHSMLQGDPYHLMPYYCPCLLDQLCRGRMGSSDLDQRPRENRSAHTHQLSHRSVSISNHLFVMAPGLDLRLLCSHRGFPIVKLSIFCIEQVK